MFSELISGSEDDLNFEDAQEDGFEDIPRRPAISSIRKRPDFIRNVAELANRIPEIPLEQLQQALEDADNKLPVALARLKAQLKQESSEEPEKRRKLETNRVDAVLDDFPEANRCTVSNRLEQSDNPDATEANIRRELQEDRERLLPQAVHGSEFMSDRERDTMRSILQIFPEVDPQYVIEQVVQNELTLENLVNKLSDDSNYPKRQQREEKEERDRERQDLLDDAQFDLQNYLLEFENPEAHFTDQTRIVTPLYTEHATVYLMNRFRNMRRDFIERQLTERGGHLLPTITYILEGQGGVAQDGCRRKPRNYQMPQFLRYDREEEIEWPNNIDELFFREIQYINHEEQIQAVVNQRQIERERRVLECRQNGGLEECSCCAEESVPEEMIRCEKLHSFCTSCVRKHAETQNAEGAERVRCLEPNCDCEYSEARLHAVLRPASFDQFVRRRQQSELRNAGLPNMQSCPFCDFAMVMDNSDDKVFRCQNPKCRKESCRNCHRLSHIPLRCNEIEQDAETRMRTYVENAMANALIRICPRCSKRLVKASGCNKLKCPCGAAICYVCRKLLPPGNPYEHFDDWGRRSRTGGTVCPGNTTMDQVHADVAERAGNEARERFLRENPGLEVKKEVKKEHVQQMVDRNEREHLGGLGHPFDEVEWAMGFGPAAHGHGFHVYPGRDRAREFHPPPNYGVADLRLRRMGFGVGRALGTRADEYYHGDRVAPRVRRLSSGTEQPQFLLDPTARFNGFGENIPLAFERNTEEQLLELVQLVRPNTTLEQLRGALMFGWADRRDTNALAEELVIRIDAIETMQKRVRDRGTNTQQTTKHQKRNTEERGPTKAELEQGQKRVDRLYTDLMDRLELEDRSWKKDKAFCKQVNQIRETRAQLRTLFRKFDQTAGRGVDGVAFGVFVDELMRLQEMIERINEQLWMRNVPKTDHSQSGSVSRAETGTIEERLAQLASYKTKIAALNESVGEIQRQMTKGKENGAQPALMGRIITLLRERDRAIEQRNRLEERLLRDGATEAQLGREEQYKLQDDEIEGAALEAGRLVRETAARQAREEQRARDPWGERAFLEAQMQDRAFARRLDSTSESEDEEYIRRFMKQRGRNGGRPEGPRPLGVYPDDSDSELEDLYEMAGYGRGTGRAQLPAYARGRGRAQKDKGTSTRRELPAPGRIAGRGRGRGRAHLPEHGTVLKRYCDRFRARARPKPEEEEEEHGFAALLRGERDEEMDRLQAQLEVARRDRTDMMRALENQLQHYDNDMAQMEREMIYLQERQEHLREAREETQRRLVQERFETTDRIQTLEDQIRGMRPPRRHEAQADEAWAAALEAQLAFSPPVDAVEPVRHTVATATDRLTTVAQMDLLLMAVHDILPHITMEQLRARLKAGWENKKLEDILPEVIPALLDVTPEQSSVDEDKLQELKTSDLPRVVADVQEVIPNISEAEVQESLQKLRKQGLLSTHDRIVAMLVNEFSITHLQDESDSVKPVCTVPPKRRTDETKPKTATSSTTTTTVSLADQQPSTSGVNRPSASGTGPVTSSFQLVKKQQPEFKIDIEMQITMPDAQLTNDTPPPTQEPDPDMDSQG